MSDKRLFTMLNKESQERVVVMKTRYEQMMPLERQAFLQELGLISTRDLEEEADRRARLGKFIRYSNLRLTEVRGRDPGFVVLQQDPLPDAAANSALPTADGKQPHYTAALPDSVFKQMLTPGLFGEEAVAVSKQRMSLYEKIGSVTVDPEDAPKAEEVAEVEEEPTTGKEVEPVGEKGTYMYRSNAYQVLRLAHSFPQHININGGNRDESETATTTMNVTGVPLYEDELQQWFDSLDAEGEGTLGVESFTKFMRSLDRDFGVDTEYDTLEKEGQRLAVEGKLGFEAFAYLVMRFARA